MNTNKIIIKYTDQENYTYFGVFSNGFIVNTEIAGCDFFVSFYDITQGETELKVYDIMLQFELEDIHDYITFIRDDDDFLFRMSNDIQICIENYISAQLAEGKTEIDLSETLNSLMEEMTEKAKAHLDGLLAQDTENRLCDHQESN